MLSKEAECLTDTRREMKARILVCKVSSPCPLSKVGQNSTQMIYTCTVIMIVVQTRDSFGRWLVKLKFHSYYNALVGERNVTVGRAVGCEIEEHQIPRYKHSVLPAAPRSNDVRPNQKIYYRPRPRLSRDSCLEANPRWGLAYRYRTVNWLRLS